MSGSCILGLMNTSASLLNALAPRGHLRASINLGNPILAGRDPATGQPAGVSLDLAHALADRLGVALELVVWDSAGKSVHAIDADQADFGFFAIDPQRGETVAFTAPYVLIEGSYLVADDSSIEGNADVDRAGIAITVGKGSAYDLFLTRALTHARIERAPTSPEVVDLFLAQGYDVAAGVRQQLEADAARIGGLRVLPDKFMVIRQAMGLHRQRGEQARAYLAAFVEDMKASGFVAQSMARHGIAGASVAPAGEGADDA